MKYREEEMGAKRSSQRPIQSIHNFGDISTEDENLPRQLVHTHSLTGTGGCQNLDRGRVAKGGKWPR